MPAASMTNAGAKALIKQVVTAAHQAKAALDSASSIYRTIQNAGLDLLRPDYEITVEDDDFAKTLGFAGAQVMRETLTALGEGAVGVLTSDKPGDARTFAGAVSRCPVYPE